MDAFFGPGNNMKIAVLASVVGAGVVVGVSGIYVYYKLNKCVERELTHLTVTVDELRREIDKLKAEKKASKSRRREKALAHAEGYFTAHPSSGDEAEEFFDFSDEGEESMNSWATLNGTVSSTTLTPPKVTFTGLFEEVDSLLDGSDVEQNDAYHRLMSMKEEYIDNSEFLWRLAKACHVCSVVASVSGQPDKKKELTLQGCKFAKMALALEDNNPEIHKWYAITLGRSGEFVSIQDKIKDGYTFKEHVEIAIQLSPKDHTLYHMLGRWCYEVAMLSWIERKVASTLFAAPPTSTFTEAREQFLLVEKLKPNQWKENLLYIAKTYIGEGTYYEAVLWLDKAALLPTKTKDDEEAQQEVELLQNKYKGYRETT